MRAAVSVPATMSVFPCSQGGSQGCPVSHVASLEPSDISKPCKQHLQQACSDRIEFISQPASWNVPEQLLLNSSAMQILHPGLGPQLRASETGGSRQLSSPLPRRSRRGQSSRRVHLHLPAASRSRPLPRPAWHRQHHMPVKHGMLSGCVQAHPGLATCSVVSMGLDLQELEESSAIRSLCDSVMQCCC